MFQLILAVLASIALAGSAEASYINFSAGMLVPASSAGPAMGVCTAATNPACTNNTQVYAEFSGTADNTAWITTTLPQDAPAAPFMRCGVAGFLQSGNSNPFSFKFSFQVVKNGADATPSTAGNTTAVVTTTPNASAEVQYDTQPSGTAVAVYDPVAAGACASSACSGRQLHIKVQRVATDGSDTNVNNIWLTTMVCEICSNSGCS